MKNLPIPHHIKQIKQNEIIMISANPNLIFQIQLLFSPTSNPRVMAAAESSSPIIEQEAISGTMLYSTASVAFFDPISIPRIRIASLIDFASSATVGKNLKITLIGIVSLSDTCIRCIAAKNSDTLVDLTIYLARIMVGSIFVITYNIRANTDSMTFRLCWRAICAK
jgi:hypothetical protein